MGSDGVALSGGGEGGNIYRCRPDGSRLERVATGFWNPFHMTFDVFGRLFAVDNDPDSRPPCRLLHIVQGGDYGYRFRNGRKGVHPFTSWNGELPGTLGMVAGTGEAPSGVVEYDRSNLPEDYRGTLLVTSWGDHRIERYRLKAHGASFRATMEPVVTGGEDFRPVGIAIAPDGSVYISDWVDKSYTLHGKGRIWRLRQADMNVIARLDRDTPEAWRKAANTLKVAARAEKIDGKLTGSVLHHDSADVRALGVSILPVGQIKLKEIAGTDPSSLVRAAAMRRLSDPSGKDLLLKALGSEDPFVQQAARMGLRSSQKETELVALAGSRDLSAESRLGLLLNLRDSVDSDVKSVLPGFLSDPDPRIRFAAIQWVGEHRLKEFRSTLQAGLGFSANARNLFEATLAALESLDGKTRNSQDEIAGEEYVAALLKDERTPAPVLQQALRMLRPDHPALSIDRFKRLLREAERRRRIEVNSAVCARARGAGDLRSWPSSPVMEAHRRQFVPRRSPGWLRMLPLIANCCSVWLLVNRRCCGMKPSEACGVSLTEGERSMLRRSNRDDAAGLELVDFLQNWGASGQRQFSGARAPGNDIDAVSAQLSGPADPAAGERVFFHTKGPGCYRCHQVQGRGSRAGPDLTALPADTSRQRLIESIVSPNKEIAPQFVAYAVARNDGTIFTGILLAQSPEGELIFADSQGRRIQIKSGDIAERKPQTISIMPEGLSGTMTKQEMRDLLAFLLHKK